MGGGANGNFAYVSDELVAGDWNDNLVLTAASPCSDSEDQRDNRTQNGNIGGPPPKLIPVSGQLEKVRRRFKKEKSFRCVVPILSLQRNNKNKLVLNAKSVFTAPAPSEV